MKFRSFVQLAGKAATGIPVPEDILTQLGAGKHPAVKVTVKGFLFRSTVGSMGGKYSIPLRSERREAARVVAGEEVDVEIEVDTEPRKVEAPEGLATALDRDTVAAKRFGELNNSKKRLIVDPIQRAKTEETRQRRIAKAMEWLRQGAI